MNEAVEKVVSYLTGQEGIEAVDIDQLRKEESESPYFPITQFLIAKKLGENNQGSYLAQVQKTAIYFSNPYWLQYLLAGDQAALDQEETRFVATASKDIPQKKEALRRELPHDASSPSEATEWTVQEIRNNDTTVTTTPDEKATLI